MTRFILYVISRFKKNLSVLPQFVHAAGLLWDLGAMKEKILPSIYSLLKILLLDIFIHQKLTSYFLDDEQK